MDNNEELIQHLADGFWKVADIGIENLSMREYLVVLASACGRFVGESIVMLADGEYIETEDMGHGETHEFGVLDAIDDGVLEAVFADSMEKAMEPINNPTRNDVVPGEADSGDIEDTVLGQGRR